MEDISKTYTIQWVGPFPNLKKMREYLNDPNTCHKSLFSFYYFCGNKNKKGYRNDYLYRYFGIHKKGNGIEQRLNTAHEHYRDFKENENLCIWIGAFSSENYQTGQNIEDVETLFLLSYRKGWFTENEKKVKASPKESICIINLWYKRNEERWQRKKKEISFIDDVLIYDRESGRILTGNLRRM